MESGADDEPGAASADELERLLAPVVRALPPPTSLSPLPFDLNAGVPDAASLPAEELAEAATRALRRDPAGALTYGGPLGYEPLRAWIAARQARESGVSLTSAHVTLTSGSAHAIDNIAATFLGQGDVVVTPAPTYPGAVRAFRARGGRIAPVPQDEDGVDPVALAQTLERLRDAGAPAKLLYLVANYDNPSGSTLPPERRETIAQLAQEHGALIVEDDAYTGIDLDGPPPPPLFAAARGRGILGVGTFSKTIATGLRVGWITAAPGLVERLAFMRFDNGSSPLVQRTVHEYLDAGHFEPHVEALRALYRERRDASARALVELCEPYVRFRSPAGGFFHWLRLAEGLTAATVVATAARQGVAVTPGTGYYPQPSAGLDGVVAPIEERGERELRLVYSALPPARLREAIERFAAALADVAAG
jgi:DNA-binding transcriptional MocR family regulator